MTETRKLGAILVADVVGYSRLAGADEERTRARLRGLRSDLIDPAIAAHRGRIVKRTGHGSMIEFPSVEAQLQLYGRSGLMLPEGGFRSRRAASPTEWGVRLRATC